MPSVARALKGNSDIYSGPPVHALGLSSRGTVGVQEGVRNS